MRSKTWSTLLGILTLFAVASSALAGENPSPEEKRSSEAQWIMDNFDVDPQQLMESGESWLAKHYKTNLALSAGAVTIGGTLIHQTNKKLRTLSGGISKKGPRSVRFLNRAGKYVAYRGTRFSVFGITGFVIHEWYPEVADRSVKKPSPLCEPGEAPTRADAVQTSSSSAQ